jgi:hypothetical protein
MRRVRSLRSVPLRLREIDLDTTGGGGGSTGGGLAGGTGGTGSWRHHRSSAPLPVRPAFSQHRLRRSPVRRLARQPDQRTIAGSSARSGRWTAIRDPRMQPGVHAHDQRVASIPSSSSPAGGRWARPPSPRGHRGPPRRPRPCRVRPAPASVRRYAPRRRSAPRSFPRGPRGTDPSPPPRWRPPGALSLGTRFCGVSLLRRRAQEQHRTFTWRPSVRPTAVCLRSTSRATPSSQHGAHRRGHPRRRRSRPQAARRGPALASPIATTPASLTASCSIACGSQRRQPGRA